MKLQLSIVESNQQIQKEILQALLPEIKVYMDSAIARIKIALPNILEAAIFSSPEYSSLVSGKLRLEFGIPDASNKITQLLNIWINNIIYIYNPPKVLTSSIRTTFSANLIRSDYADVVSADFANVQDSSGYSLPWLRWLLLDGTAIIVPDHQVVIGPNRSSRTGFAIMRKSMRGWNVPPEFAGTESDNWITRAIDSASSQIEELLDRTFT